MKVKASRHLEFPPGEWWEGSHAKVPRRMRRCSARTQTGRGRTVCNAQACVSAGAFVSWPRVTREPPEGRRAGRRVRSRARVWALGRAPAFPGRRGSSELGRSRQPGLPVLRAAGWKVFHWEKRPLKFHAKPLAWYPLETFSMELLLPTGFIALH